MSTPKEFGIVSRLTPEAIGVPGKRTFRVLAESGGDSAVLWLEKEQLSQIALTIRQLLIDLPENEGATEEPHIPPPAVLGVSLEFKVGRLALGYEEKSGLFFLEAHDVEAEEEEETALRFWVHRSQMEEFANEALKVCASGRPLCTLCGRPMDPAGHACVRSNGHQDASFL